MVQPEVLDQIQEISKRAGYLWRFLNLAGKQEDIRRLEEAMADPEFWNDSKRAKAQSTELVRLKRMVGAMEQLKGKVEDLETLVELVKAASDEEAEVYLGELEETKLKLDREIDAVELDSFLSGPHDNCHGILTIHAGAGGTESCDWADMLLRMYQRWAERAGFGVEIQDLQPGEEAGISRATLRITGENAYGFAKAERGVHRLVRISPFDSNKRRHTSFCSVDVIAEIDDEIDYEVKEEDLRVDTYRASGKGGQHVNKTDSAVRLTHLPTGIVVACQNERSQHKNKATAMKILKSRIFEKLEDEKRAEMERFYGDKGEIGWGNQIRSYVFQPYQMVKDLRTGAETSNVQEVMDGDIDAFIHAWLRAGCPRSRTDFVEEE
ncbi:MAG: peptide chain release factor 2 [Puniceicoccaceae bacterium]